MKYKVGDKVWIKSDIILGKEGYGRIYKVTTGEEDIRGKQVIITGTDGDFVYTCKEYRFFSDRMIDEWKTRGFEEPQYEIY